MADASAVGDSEEILLEHYVENLSTWQNNWSRHVNIHFN